MAPDKDSATAEALHAICDLDLTELEAIVPPAASAEIDLRNSALDFA